MNSFIRILVLQHALKEHILQHRLNVWAVHKQTVRFVLMCNALNAQVNYFYMVEYVLSNVHFHQYKSYKSEYEDVNFAMWVAQTAIKALLNAVLVTVAI